MRTFILAVTGALCLTACSSYDGSPTFTEPKTPVASVLVNLPASSLVAGQTERGVAILRDATGATLTDRAITWQSSNVAAATVDGSGTIAAVAPGITSIVATSEGVSGQGDMTVLAVPVVPVASVSVALSPSAVLIGQTSHATATLRDASGNTLTGRSIAWQTSNASVATISASGDLSALAAGSAVITGSSEGQSGSSTLTVSAPAPIPVASVSVSPATSSLQVGATVQLTATTRDANNAVLTGRTVTWSSASPNVATVSPSGLVTAVGAGSANVSASSEGQIGSATITVTAPVIPVASVSVSPATSSLQVGATVQLTATTRDANNAVLTGRAVAWSSGTTSVATVSSGGLVTAVNAGTAIISATSEGRVGTSTITVTLVPIASISLSPASANVAIGQTLQLTATVRDAGGNVLTGRTLNWASSNSAVASVSSSGLVRSLITGSTTITASSGSVNGASSITVPAPPPPPVGGSAPEPGAGDVIFWQDGFNVATLTDLDRSYIWSGQRQLVTDGHTGSAVRFFYNAGNYDNIIEQTVPTTKDIYIRYWYRLSPGADPTCNDRGGSGMKWFMAHRPESLNLPRYTFGVGHLDGPPSVAPQTGNEFTVHDNGSNDMWNPFIQNISKTPRFGTTNDGAWHKYTVHIVTDRGDGSGTGYEQIWVDGTLVLDDSGFNYHHEPTGVSRINFPGNVVDWYSGCDFTIDVDDFAIWHK